MAAGPMNQSRSSRREMIQLVPAGRIPMGWEMAGVIALVLMGLSRLPIVRKDGMAV
jgi:hypothetical protein